MYGWRFGNEQLPRWLTSSSDERLYMASYDVTRLLVHIASSCSLSLLVFSRFSSFFTSFLFHPIELIGKGATGSMAVRRARVTLCLPQAYACNLYENYIDELTPPGVPETFHPMGPGSKKGREVCCSCIINLTVEHHFREGVNFEGCEGRNQDPEPCLHTPGLVTVRGRYARIWVEVEFNQSSL